MLALVVASEGWFNLFLTVTVVVGFFGSRLHGNNAAASFFNTLILAQDAASTPMQAAKNRAESLPSSREATVGKRYIYLCISSKWRRVKSRTRHGQGGCRFLGCSTCRPTLGVRRALTTYTLSRPEQIQIQGEKLGETNRNQPYTSG